MKNKAKKRKKNSSKKALSKLKKIKKLSKENFVLLRPIGGVRGGHYLDNCRVYDYFGLFCTLRSTLNVCILALEGQIDLTLDIKDKESDVISVLEFAKNLIPLEEGQFLDEMRKLMLSDKKND
jgi:hypothetical protein